VVRPKEGGRKIAQQDISVNEKIRNPRVLVIDEEGNKIGIMMTRDAVAMARERGLDLVEVAAAADPPVARILDFGKYQYTQQKRQRDAKKKQVAQQVREIKFRTKTDVADLQTKLKKARQFLEEGDRVKIHVVYRGREMAHPELGRKMLTRVLAELTEWGAPLDEGAMQGRSLISVLAPHPKGTMKKAKPEPAPPPAPGPDKEGA